LEGGARLSMTLGGEVEGPVLEVGAAHHSPDPAGLVVDRHQRRTRPDAREAARDRLLGGALVVEVERRADLEAATERGAGPVPRCELVLHPGAEVRGLADLARRLDAVARWQRLWNRGGVLARRQEVLVAHLLKHEVAPLERRR